MLKLKLKLKLKIQKAMQDDAILTARINPDRAEVFMWQNFQPTLITES